MGVSNITFEKKKKERKKERNKIIWAVDLKMY